MSPPGYGPTRRQRWLSQPGVRGAIAVLGVLVLVATFAPLITPHDPRQILDPVLLRSQPPSWSYPLGTDPYARDLLSRLIAGTRSSLTLALTAVALATLVGTATGLWGGLVGGRTDRLLSRLVDVSLSIPRVLLILTIAGLWAVPGPVVLAVILGGTGWMGLTRLVRDEIHARRFDNHILAAHALGIGQGQLLIRHLLPDVMPLIAVWATTAFGQVLLLEAGLSFLGIGVPAPFASWGNVLLDVGDVIGRGRWLAIGPGLLIVVTVSAVHRLGDALHVVTEARQSRNVL